MHGSEPRTGVEPSHGEPSRSCYKAAESHESHHNSATTRRHSRDSLADGPVRELGGEFDCPALAQAVHTIAHVDFTTLVLPKSEPQVRQVWPLDRTSSEGLE